MALTEIFPKYTYIEGNDLAGVLEIVDKREIIEAAGTRSRCVTEILLHQRFLSESQ